MAIFFNDLVENKCSEMFFFFRNDLCAFYHKQYGAATKVKRKKGCAISERPDKFRDGTAVSRANRSCLLD